MPTNRGPIPVEKFAKHTQEMQATDGFSVEYDVRNDTEDEDDEQLEGHDKEKKIMP